MRIRPAKLSDAEAIQKVLHEKSIIKFAGGFTHIKTIKDKISKPTTSFFVACIDDEIVGVAGLEGRKMPHLIKLNPLAVLPEFRGKNIAVALYVVRLAQGIIEGRRLAETVVMAENKPVQGLLNKIGFQLSGTFPQYTGAGTDMCYFHCCLSPSPEAKFLRLLPMLPDPITIYMDDPPDGKAAENRARAYKVYDRHFPDLSMNFEVMREMIHTAPDFMINTTRIKPKGLRER